MDKFNTGDIVRINDKVNPRVFAGQECIVLRKTWDLNDKSSAYLLTVSHPQYNEPVLVDSEFLDSEFTLVTRKADNGQEH